MKPSLLLLSVACFLGLNFSARASSAVGFSIDPMGNAWSRNELNTAFAQWDLFSTYTIVDDAPDAAFGLTNALLDQAGTLTGIVGTDQGAGVYESFGSGASGSAGDKLMYSGNRPLAFTLTGDVAFAIKGFTLQVKRVLSAAGTESGFIVRLNGLAPDAAVTVSGTGDTETSTGGVYSTTTYYWGNSLASSNATNFTVEFSTAATTGTRTALDTISIDAGPAAAVPEPSAAVLLATSAGLTALSRRRKNCSWTGCIGR